MPTSNKHWLPQSASECTDSASIAPEPLSTAATSLATKIAKFAEEHGFLDLARSNTRPEVGDVVRIVPNHVCVVVNMMDEVVMVRGDEILGTLPVAARGKLR